MAPFRKSGQFPGLLMTIKRTPKPDTDTSSVPGAAQDTDRETATDTGTDTAAETATDTYTGTKTKTDRKTETVLGTPPDPGITLIGDVLEAPAEVQMLPQALTLQQVQLLPEQSLPEVLTLPQVQTLQQVQLLPEQSLPKVLTLPQALTLQQVQLLPEQSLPEVLTLPQVQTLQQVQLLPEQSLPKVLTLPQALTLQQLEPIQQVALEDVLEVTPADVPEVTPADVPEVTPEVFPTGAPPVTQAPQTPLGVPLRTPPGGKPPPKKKRRRLPLIGLGLDDPSVQPSTGGAYPRLLRHTETVEVTTDLDTGLSHVELLKTVSPPRVVGRDSDPPVVRPRFSGQQRITAQGRIVRSQPVKKRRKNVHRKLHPYAQFRRDIRRAQRRSGGRQA